MTDLAYWQTKPIIRRADGSFVIELESGPYHVPNEGAYAELYSAVSAYVLENPQSVTVLPDVEPEPAEFNPGPDYEKRGDDWYKVRFTVLDFRSLFLPSEKEHIRKLIREGNDAVAAIYDDLQSAQLIDITDPRTQGAINLLAGAKIPQLYPVGLFSGDQAPVLSADRALTVLGGVKYEKN